VITDKFNDPAVSFSTYSYIMAFFYCLLKKMGKTVKCKFCKKEVQKTNVCCRECLQVDLSRDSVDERSKTSMLKVLLDEEGIEEYFKRKGILKNKEMSCYQCEKSLNLFSTLEYEDERIIKCYRCLECKVEYEVFVNLKTEHVRVYTKSL